MDFELGEYMDIMVTSIIYLIDYKLYNFRRKFRDIGQNN